MGLIGFVFTPVVHPDLDRVHLAADVHQAAVALAAPGAECTAGTITFAPNFAYGLCTTRVKEAERRGWTCRAK
jgi:hypothetical protein